MTDMRAVLKKTPGVVPLVRFVRGVPGRVMAGVSRAFMHQTKRMSWRGQMFATLPGRFAISAHARENYVVNTSDKVIGRSLYVRGDFDLPKFERAMDILRDKRGLDGVDMLFDVGGNIGPICVAAVNRGYARKAIAFEPDLDNFRLLQINILLNGLEASITCHRMAVGCAPGTAFMARNEDNHGDHRVIAGATGGDTQVEVTTIDSHLAGVDLARCLFWVDVQGFEAEVLAGAPKALAAKVPLVLELVASEMRDSGDFEPLCTHLLAAPYDTFYVLDEVTPKPRALTLEALNELADALEKADTFTDILVI